MSEQNNATPAPGSAGLDAPGLQRRRLGRIAGRFAQTLRTRGIGALVQEMRSAVLYRLHSMLPGPAREDRLIGVTTALDELTVTGNHRAQAVEYAPTPPLIIKWITRLLPGDAANWTFIDVGAGRGRVVLAAACSYYAEVLGIEFAAELQRDAARAIERMPRAVRKAGKVSVRLADATQFDIPEGACIFYLFNPFGAPVIDAFLNNVIASMEKSPRAMRIAYFNPVHSDVIKQYPQISTLRLPLLARLKFALLSPHGFKLYEVQPAATGRNRYI